MTDNRNEFIERTKEKLDVLDARIEMIEAKANEKQGEARRELEDKLQEFRDAKSDLSDRLTELKNSGGDAWDEVKDGIEQSWNTLSASLERATARLQ